MILYIENPEDATRKLLELINEFNKVAGYKINTQKFLAYLYTNNNRPGGEIWESVTFNIRSKIIKCIGIKLLKKVKKIYIQKPIRY